MTRDGTDDDQLPMTQENLATMVDGGRPRINALPAALEQDGFAQPDRDPDPPADTGWPGGRACERHRQLSRR